MKRLTAEPDKDVNKVKLRSAFHGEGAYEAFKQIASEFYKDHTYKFVALTLIGCPQLDSVEFEAQFWRVPSEAATQPPNDPLTLEELREMDGEPVWICDPDRSDGMWALVDLEYELCRTAKGGIAIFDTYGKTWLAYRRKPDTQKEDKHEAD